jgi:hypothetical protein
MAGVFGLYAHAIVPGEYVAVLTDDEVDALSHALGCRRPQR